MMSTFARSTLIAILALASATACGGSTESRAPARTEEPPMEGQRLSLYTHCGVLSVVVDGQLWLADPPLRNPPDGWDENSTEGNWSETESRRAVFRADSGKVAHFITAPPGQEDPNKGCE
jgi:hypothetical protein